MNINSQTQSSTKQRTNSKYKYAPINTNENDNYNDIDDEFTPNLSNIQSGIPSNNNNDRARAFGKKINTWLHSLFWIGLAIFVIQYSDLIRVIRIDERIILPLLYLSGISWFCVISLFIYLGLYLPFIKKQKIDDYNVTHSEHIKITLLLTFISVITFIIGIWPVWRWMSIPITLSMLMGCIMIPNILPSF